jgi:hypothetical protein
MSVLIDNIATFLAESPEWVENWINTPVKNMSISQSQPNIDFPDFAVSFFNNLPLEYFDTSHKLNRNWYRECRRELDRRRKACIKKYWATVEEYKEAGLALDNCWENGGSKEYLHQCECNNYELHDRKYEEFEDWVAVEQACLNCGFPDLIDHANPKYYIKMYGDGFDPYEIPTQDELEEEWGLLDDDDVYSSVASDDEDNEDDDDGSAADDI